MPLRAAQQRQCVAAASGRGGVDRHAESTHQLQVSSCERVEPAHRNSQAVSKSTSQTVAGEHTKTAKLWRMVRRYSQAFGMRLTSGRAKTTSVIDAINRRAGHGGKLAGTYPYTSKQSSPAAMRVIRLQLRCNLDSRRDVRTRFPIEFAIWPGRWSRPCVKYRFNSYTSRGLTTAGRLYIQNEGLRENFWEDRANEDAKRCCSPFITARRYPPTARPVCHDHRRGGRPAYR